MNDEGKPLQPDHIFKRVIWRSTLSIASPMEQATTWSLTAVAAVVGLLISNLDSVSKIASIAGIKTTIFLLASSLLAGAVSKSFGMALTAGLKTVAELETLLNSPQGKALMEQMTIQPKQLARDLAQPFFWPLSTLMRKSGEQGLTDYLSTDKRWVRMFCVQLYLNTLHGLLVVAALGALAWSI